MPAASGEMRGRGDGAPRAPERQESPATRPGPFTRILTGLRVVVVDDDSDVLELFAVALTACGAEVSRADNARDALALTARLRPHVVVSDLAVTGEDGYWLVRELRRRRDDVLPAVPVLAATAYGREHPRARVLAAGFDELVHEPLDPEELRRRGPRPAEHRAERRAQLVGVWGDEELDVLADRLY
jgi:CheY-like chemotaxis protein